MPLKDQIVDMKNKIIEANPKTENEANLICTDLDRIHALGTAFQTFVENESDIENVWCKWTSKYP